MALRPLNLPSGPVSPVAAALANPQPLPQPDGAFVWGEGGQRLSPEDVAMRRDRAAGMMQSDYSPVGHWTQGLGRVADNWLGALEMRDARRDAGQLERQRGQEIAALLGPENADLAGAFAGSDPVTQALAKSMWEQRNPKPQQPTEMQRNYEWLQAMNPQYADTFLQGKIDPEIIIPLPSGPYVGPRSQLGATVDAGQPPQQSQPSGEVADFGGASSMLQALGPQGFLQWQQKHNVPVRVTSPEEMLALPPGTIVQSPDGRTAVKR